MSKIQEAIRKVASGHTAAATNIAAAARRQAPAQPQDEETQPAIEIAPARRLTIDWKALRDAGLLAPESDGDLLARQIRDIKRPLLAHAFGKRATPISDGNLIMVASALSGEGKTFISFNLAHSMAQERDYSVLLVDADVAKRQTSELFADGDDLGLLDLLERDDLSLNSVIIRTDEPGLSILPAGVPRAHANELLASTAMERLAAELASADPNRVVIFDTSPLLQTSESKVLAGFVGQVALVVAADQTSVAAVVEAVHTLGEDSVVNLILNKSTSSKIVTSYEYGGSSMYKANYQYGDPGAAGYEAAAAGTA